MHLKQLREQLTTSLESVGTYKLIMQDLRSGDLLTPIFLNNISQIQALKEVREIYSAHVICASIEEMK